MDPESPKRDFFSQPSSLKLPGVISKLKETKGEGSLAVNAETQTKCMVSKFTLNTMNTLIVHHVGSVASFFLNLCRLHFYIFFNWLKLLLCSLFKMFSQFYKMKEIL